MPGWLSFLISLAIKIGSPYLLEYVKKWSDKISPDVMLIINELLDALRGAKLNVSDAKEIKKVAMRKAKRAIKARRGVGSPPETKSLI